MLKVILWYPMLTKILKSIIWFKDLVIYIILSDISWSYDKTKHLFIVFHDYNKKKQEKLEDHSYNDYLLDSIVYILLSINN